jgi:hypothetical protein
MSVGQNYTLTCTASGANPPALLSWWDWRGQRVLIPPTDQLTSDGSARAESSSNSVLVFSPRAEDEGKSLSCRAEHRSLKSRMETSRILSVSCKHELSRAFNSRNPKFWSSSARIGFFSLQKSRAIFHVFKAHSIHKTFQRSISFNSSFNKACTKRACFLKHMHCKKC